MPHYCPYSHRAENYGLVGWDSNFYRYSETDGGEDSKVIATFGGCLEAVEFLLNNNLVANDNNETDGLLNAVVLYSKEFEFIYDFLNDFFYNEYNNMSYSEANEYYPFVRSVYTPGMMQALHNDSFRPMNYSPPSIGDFTTQDLIQFLDDVHARRRRPEDFKDVFFEVADEYGFTHIDYNKFIKNFDGYNKELLNRFIDHIYHQRIRPTSDSGQAIMNAYKFGASFDDVKEYLDFDFKVINEILMNKGYVLVDSNSKEPLTRTESGRARIKCELRELN